MSVASFIFYLFAALMAYAGIRVITSRNPVHSALHLMLLFFLSSGIWLLLRAEFLALALILIYVGAVMVLVLFVIMMLDIEKSFLVNQLKKNYGVAVVLAVVLFVDIVLAINSGFSNYAPPNEDVLKTLGSAKNLGLVMFKEFFLPVEVASLVLLVAIVAAVVLTLRERKDVHSQVVSKQLLANKENRLQVTDDAYGLPSSKKLP